MPCAARPTAKPMIPCSERGVLKTRSEPNSVARFIEHRKTPPKATSSPKRRVDSEWRRERVRAELMDWKRLRRVQGEEGGREGIVERTEEEVWWRSGWEE